MKFYSFWSQTSLKITINLEVETILHKIQWRVSRQFDETWIVIILVSYFENFIDWYCDYFSILQFSLIRKLYWPVLSLVRSLLCRKNLWLFGDIQRWRRPEKNRFHFRTIWVGFIGLLVIIYFTLPKLIFYLNLNFNFNLVTLDSSNQ